MRSMTGYGHGETTRARLKFDVEIQSVNRKQSDIVVSLPRELAALEPRVRELVGAQIWRGRTNVTISSRHETDGDRKLALDSELARSYHRAMLKLKKELGAAGEITIGAILQAPGVLRMEDESPVIKPEVAWPLVREAVETALKELVRMREREGKHLADDLRKRLTVIRTALKQLRLLYPRALKRYRDNLIQRVNQAGLNIALDDERLLKEISFYADRSDVSEELTRLESHLTQFVHHLRKSEPVGRTLEFITQEMFRELNTLGSKSTDSAISTHVVACKAELEKIREQIQNLE